MALLASASHAAEFQFKPAVQPAPGATTTTQPRQAPNTVPMHLPGAYQSELAALMNQEPVDNQCTWGNQKPQEAWTEWDWKSKDQNVNVAISHLAYAGQYLELQNEIALCEQRNTRQRVDFLIKLQLLQMKYEAARQ